MRDSFVYLGMTSAAFFIGQGTRIPHARHDQAVLNPGHLGFVQAKPGDGTNGAGDEEKPIGVSP